MNLNQNVLKQKLRTGEQVLGCWVTLAHPLIPEILAPARFDFLVMDMEHSSIDLTDLLALIMATEKNGMAPLVRVGENNPNLIKRVMDAGAYGVIVANVCSRAEAEQAVASVKYPPAGKRGVGLYRAQGYGKQFDDYLDWVDQQSVVIVQIEHIDAVQDIDSILTTPGIDAYMIGPYDLSGSMGKPGRFEDPDVAEAVERVLAAGRKHGVVAGLHSVPSDPAIAAEKAKAGFKFLAFSLDSIFLGDAVQNAVKELHAQLD